jgi:hypothetical protein
MEVACLLWKSCAHAWSSDGAGAGAGGELEGRARRVGANAARVVRSLCLLLAQAQPGKGRGAGTCPLAVGAWLTWLIEWEGGLLTNDSMGCRMLEMTAAHGELQSQLRQVQTIRERAESSLQLAQDEQFNAEALMEGSLKTLRQRCADLQRLNSDLVSVNARLEKRLAAADSEVWLCPCACVCLEFVGSVAAACLSVCLPSSRSSFPCLPFPVSPSVLGAQRAPLPQVKQQALLRAQESNLFINQVLSQFVCRASLCERMGGWMGGCVQGKVHGSVDGRVDELESSGAWGDGCVRLQCQQVSGLEAKVQDLNSAVSRVADPRCCTGLL